MSLSQKKGVESEWPRKGVVTVRITVGEWGHYLASAFCLPARALPGPSLCLLSLVVMDPHSELCLMPLFIETEILYNIYIIEMHKRCIAIG